MTDEIRPDEPKEATGDKPTNVIPIGRGRKKAEKLDKRDRERAFVTAMKMPWQPPLFWDIPFHRKFAHYQDETGGIMLLEISKENVLSVTSRESAVNAIMAYSRMPLTEQTAGELELSSREATEILTVYVATTAPVDMAAVAPVRMYSDKGLCWHRLPFDPAPGPTPTFDELLGRTENAEPLKAWIGSLLVAQSERQQYVWLWGTGSNGKSSLANFLARVMGRGYRSEQPPAAQDRFWTSGIVGARLVVFPDCNNQNFVTSGLFKSLTGDDPVRIEHKGRQPFSMQLQPKFMFLSNTDPLLSSGEADRRRAIYCRMASLPEGTKLVPSGQYNERLWREGPGFIEACIKAYTTLTEGEHGRIPVDTTGLDQLIEWSESENDLIFEKYLELDPAGKVPSRVISYLLKEEGFKTQFDKSKFYRWLEMKYRIQRKAIKTDQGKTKYLVGVKVNEKTEKEKELFLKGESPV